MVPGSILNISAAFLLEQADGPEGGGHTYMDVGSRAMQEQLPRSLE